MDLFKKDVDMPGYVRYSSEVPLPVDGGTYKSFFDRVNAACATQSVVLGEGIVRELDGSEATAVLYLYAPVIEGDPDIDPIVS